MTTIIRQVGTCFLRQRNVPQASCLHLFNTGKYAEVFDAKSITYTQKLNMSSGWFHQFQANGNTFFVRSSIQTYPCSLRCQSSDATTSSSPDIMPQSPTAVPEGTNNALSSSSPSSDVISESSSSPSSDVISESSDGILSVASNIEPSLASQGLGGWSPVGILQHCLEYAHIDLNIPWWLAIAIGTVIVRTLMFPLVIVAQRNAAHMNNNLPQMQVLQMKMSNARNSGNALEAARYAHEFSVFMKERQINPLKSMLVPLVQAPVFISFFFALRGMANLPLESFKTGGLFWFENLTVADPYYLLPLITSATLFITIEIGAEGGIRMDNMQLMRYFLRAMPIIIFPFTINFPSAVLCYWVTTNAYSLCQVALLRFGPIRTYFNIPKLRRHETSNLPVKKKGFVEGVKDAFTNVKISRDLEERSRLDNVRFTKAGMGPIQKTYPYDPTKQSAASVQTKKPDRH